MVIPPHSGARREVAGLSAKEKLWAAIPGKHPRFEPEPVSSSAWTPASYEEDQNILICVKQVTLRRQFKRVYLLVVALALPSGNAVASGSMQHGVSMRDLVADWKKWSRAERVLAVMVTLLMVASPLGLLVNG